MSDRNKQRSISVRVDPGVPGRAVQLLDAAQSTMGADPVFQYASLSASLVYRVALEEGLRVLEERYLGPGAVARAAQPKAPQPKPAAPVLPAETPAPHPAPNERKRRGQAKPSRPRRPRVAPAAGDAMTGKGLRVLLDRCKDLGVSRREIAEAMDAPVNTLSTLLNRPRLTSKMDARIRAAVTELGHADLL